MVGAVMAPTFLGGKHVSKSQTTLHLDHGGVPAQW